MRALLSGPTCLSPASVYDPLSARVAESVGFEVGLLSGSVVSATTLAAPDLVLHTLTEYAEQIRRITRASRLSLLVDADHGYGNALNVMRTVAEFEHAGVSAVGIEDTIQPLAFGHSEDEARLVPIQEGIAKMRAAVAARSDPDLVIAARTPALELEGLDSVVARAKAYAAAGVDAIWMTSLESVDQLDAVRASAPLPIFVGTRHGAIANEELAAHGVRIALQGHLPLAAAVKALREAYTHLFDGGSADDLKSRVAPAAEMDELVNHETYRRFIREFNELARPRPTTAGRCVPETLEPPRSTKVRQGSGRGEV
jgi:carboxyvinyl-carboxyphosphonate phosphorylmutase